MINPDNPSRTVGTVSLVCGILAIFPFGALAGVPAVVLAIFALREEPRSRGRAWAGVALGGVGIAITVVLVLLVSVWAKARSHSSPTTSGANATRYKLYEIQGSLEDWASAHGGAFPYQTDFDSDSSAFVKFLARDKVG